MRIFIAIIVFIFGVCMFQLGKRGASSESRLEQDRKITPPKLWTRNTTPAYRPLVGNMEEIPENLREQARADAEKMTSNSSYDLPPVDLDRLKTDPAYHQERIRLEKIRYYHISPAKDTPECQTIVDLLKKHGFGLDVVMGAYGVAWENKRAQDILAGYDVNQREEVSEGILKAYTGRAIGDFKERNPTIPDEVILELLKITPKVFFGNAMEFMLDAPVASQ